MWRSSGVAAVEVVAPPAAVCEVSPDAAGTPRHLLLAMPLAAVRVGNVALLKLISSENKMEEFDDPADEPNVDVQYVALRGVGLRLTVDDVALL